MRTIKGLAALLLATGAVGGCDRAAPSNEANGATAAETENGATIAAGLPEDGRLLAAARAAGLDRTLEGPGPYTVLAPTDEAFGKLPAGALDALLKPEAKAQLTGVLTYHILPGTVLAADIGKAIDNGNGKAVLATMGGGQITATREGDAILLADSSGAKARVLQADQQRSNGVVHNIDLVLMPS